MPRERIVTGQSEGEESDRLDLSLRPKRFAQYIGQASIVQRLQIAVEAARGRNEPIDHILLHGPPGLGKTTLAYVVAAELGSTVHVTSGPALAKPNDLLTTLLNLQRGDVLFIDEIHRLPVTVEESLYSAMEDFRIEFKEGEGTHARLESENLEPFTLVGATTRIGLLTGAMRSRFGLVSHLDFYDVTALQTILRQNCGMLSLSFDETALAELARRSRGTPRIANKLLRRVRDYAAVKADGRLTTATVRDALKLEGVDDRGLDELDRTFLRVLIDFYAGGPAGIEALAATMSEEVDTLADVIEPYMLQQGFITRTRQGRRASKIAYEHLGLKWSPPKDANAGPELFEE